MPESKRGVMSDSEQKPEYAFLATLIGGIFILVDGAIGFMIAVRSGYWYIWIWDFPYSAFLLGALGIVLGVLIIMSGIMGYKKIQRTSVIGMMVIALSIASFILTMGGFVIGFGFGLVGGILFLVWEPAEMKNCLHCGKTIKLDSWYCPHCGYTYVQPYYQYPQYQYQYQQAQPQAQAQPAATGQKFCMKCRAGLAEGAAFCSQCGQQT